MGNCQAIDAAALAIQHPDGKVDRLYSSVTASHVMKANPGHCVALLISTSTLSTTATTNNNNPVRLTRIKLLKPTDTLLLGHVYRLLTAQEVMKGLRERERKQAKVKQNKSESAKQVTEKLGFEMERAARSSDPEDNQVTKHERHIARTTTITASSTNNNVVGSATAKTRFWQPSLQSISEAAS